MKCPKCKYDIWHIYERVIESNKNSRYCKITNFHSAFSIDVIGGYDWDVECMCPKCKTKWITFDSSY